MSNEKNIKDAPELETEKTPEFDINGYEVVSEDEVNEVMKKYDRESNTRIWVGVPQRVVQGVMALFSVYCIISTLFLTSALEMRMTAFLGCVIIMGFLYYPASKHHVKPNYIPWYDILIMVVGAGCFFYYCFNSKEIIETISSASKMTPMYNVIAIVGILVLMELCRRCVGVPILVVVAALLFYTFGIANLSLERALYTLFYRTGGVIGTPIQVCAKFIVVFIVFGAFLERTGISKFFIDLANKIAGASAGGPAKVAVISSALCGMVSGSSVGNTVTTGSVTIPMMKKTGYKPEFAGAVEAASSTGGQIMPPIMGAAAFIMAEMTGYEYADIIVRAILPAFLYFLGIFLGVHFKAKKLGLVGLKREELPKWKLLLPKIYLLLPLIVLTWMVVAGQTMAKSAIYGTIVAIVVGIINKDDRMTPSKFVNGLENGGKNCLSIGIACGIAGIISVCITMTGLGGKLITYVVKLSGGNLFIALFLTMICCIILGMGVPTTANYIIMASTCAPILINGMSMHILAANMFVFYFGIVADITPPVALAAYAGAAIAKAPPMKTAFNATRLAIAAFIIPYIFAYNNAMIFVGDVTFFGVASIVISATLGMASIASGFMGYLIHDLKWYSRIALVAGGLLMVIPGTVTDLAGLAILIVILLIQRAENKKEKKAAV